MDFSIDIFDCVAANPKHMFASLKEGDRAAVMPDTGAVSSGPSPFWNIGKRLTDACGRSHAGAGAAELVAWAFAHSGVFFLPLHASAQVMDSIPR
ncbi:MAG: hypothetical protein NTU95_03250 [Methanothrix sp.]|nr:hypothetical protein [Methanothrix sp.]